MALFPPRVATLVLIGAASACAAPMRARTTWEQDRAEGIRTALPEAPPKASVARTAMTAVPDVEISAAAYPAEVLARRMEAALLRFASDRRQLAAHLPEGSAGWPEPLSALWAQLLGELEDGFRLATPGTLPRRLLIQARVTTEAEQELTDRRFGPAEENVAERIHQLHAIINWHMRSSLAGTRAPPPPPTADVPHLAWPISPIIITSGFGYRRDPVLGRAEVRFHAGIDLGANRGDPVYASACGVVIQAGWSGGHGQLVAIQHPGGYQTLYAHLSRILVATGDEIDTGHPLGLVGSTGRSTGPHLHFEVRKDGVPVDPMDSMTLSHEESREPTAQHRAER